MTQLIDWNSKDIPTEATHALTTGKDWNGYVDYKGIVRYAALAEGRYYDKEGLESLNSSYNIGDKSWIVISERPKQPLKQQYKFHDKYKCMEVNDYITKAHIEAVMEEFGVTEVEGYLSGVVEGNSTTGCVWEYLGVRNGKVFCSSVEDSPDEVEMTNEEIANIIMPHKHASLIIAWANGSEIESKQSQDIIWWYDKNPTWDLDNQYRIKPSRLGEIATNTRKINVLNKEYATLSIGKRHKPSVNNSILFEEGDYILRSDFSDDEWQLLEDEWDNGQEFYTSKELNFTSCNRRRDSKIKFDGEHLIQGEWCLVTKILPSQLIINRV